MKQLYLRIRKLETRLPVKSGDQLSEVFALSFSGLSDDQLERIAEVLTICGLSQQLELSEPQQVAWDCWDAELARAAEELHCTTLLKADDLRARA